MSKPIPSKNYGDIAKALKNIGAIDYDLRRELTPHQKANITRKYNNMRDVLKNPEDYAFKSVNDRIKKDAARLGIITTKKFMIVEKAGYQDVVIKTRTKKHGRKETTIIKKSPNKKESTKLIHGKRLLTALENVKGDMPKGKFITVRVGKNAHFKRRFKSAKELAKYLSTFQPKGKSPQEVIDLMSVVTFGETPKTKKGKTNAKKKETTKKVGRH